MKRVAISQEAVEGVITCVQDFVHDPSFTQRSFFSDTGVAMLKIAVFAEDTVIMSMKYNPWPVFGDRCKPQVVSDLQSCPDKVVVWR